MAANVQNLPAESLPLRLATPKLSMNRDFQTRFTTILLTLLTVGAIVLGWINFQKEREFQVPYDGAWWLERNGSLVAERVDPDGPAIQSRESRLAISSPPWTSTRSSSTASLMRELYRVGAWSKATYSLVRHSVPVDVTLIRLRRNDPNTTGCG